MDEQGDKRRPITSAQWVAARAVSEGAPATRTRVADLLGCDTTAVYARATAEGWKRLDFRTKIAIEAHRDFIDRVAGQGITGLTGPDEDAPSAIVENDLDSVPQDEPAGCVRTETGPSVGELLEETETPFALLARAAKLLAHRLADLVARGEAGGRLNKAEIDGLLALARMTERWETLAKERANEEEAKSDEDIAETLRVIDRRIVELAHAEAARLVKKRFKAGDGAAGSG